MNKLILLTSILALTVSCTSRSEKLEAERMAQEQAAAAAEPSVPGLNNPDGSIASDHDAIDLNRWSQAQQEKDRKIYAEKIAAIAAERTESTVSSVPTLDTVNPTQYARSTTNALGVKIYSRSLKMGSCGRYSSAYEAQRAFLKAGGPQTDTLGLDRDGDGFACKFDPTPFRSI